MPINNRNTLATLETNYISNPDRYVFFVGAGLSMPVFPSWKTFLTDLLIASEACESWAYKNEGDDLREKIERGEDLLDIAGACSSALGKSKYRDILENTFDKEIDSSSLPKAYRKLLELQPQSILTTNYDRIPDILGEGTYKVYTNQTISEASRALHKQSKFILKLHGAIEAQSSIVLTASDYQRIIHGSLSIRTFLSSLLSNKKFIFIGFSMSDPHICNLLSFLKEVNDDLPLSHYALLNESSSFKISSYESNYGLNIIGYTTDDQSHPEVVEFIECLSKTPGTLSNVAPKADNTPQLPSVESVIRFVSKGMDKGGFSSEYSILESDRDLFLSLTSNGETTAEIQKEVLAVISLLKIRSYSFKDLIICFFSNNEASFDYELTQKAILKVVVNFQTAIQYASHDINASTLWARCKFYEILSLNSVFEDEVEVAFSLRMELL